MNVRFRQAMFQKKYIYMYDDFLIELIAEYSQSQ